MRFGRVRSLTEDREQQERAKAGLAFPKIATYGPDSVNCCVMPSKLAEGIT